MNKLKVEIEQVSWKIANALAEVGKECGYTFKVGTITYETDGNFKMRIEALKDGAKTEEQKAYEANRQLLGLPEWGTLIEITNMVHKIVGINQTGSKVILVRQSTGKRYLMDTGAVKDKLK
jgi:hypothetical protein